MVFRNMHVKVQMRFVNRIHQMHLKYDFGDEDVDDDNAAYDTMKPI